MPNGKFAPGNCANPRGRPVKADCLISCIKAELEKLSENNKSTNEQLIAAALVSKAKMGDIKAIELLLEYTAMKPAQAINLGGSDTGPVKLVVEYANAQG